MKKLSLGLILAVVVILLAFLNPYLAGIIGIAGVWFLKDQENRNRMKMLKEILGCKIYIWFAALIALVGLFFYWYGMNQNNNKSADSSQSYSMVKYIEATNETVFLNVGIEKVDALSNATKVLGITIPYSQKKAIIILNYEAKLGIKRAVSINKTRENNFEIKIPKFEVIGVNCTIEVANY